MPVTYKFLPKEFGFYSESIGNHLRVSRKGMKYAIKKDRFGSCVENGIEEAGAERAKEAVVVV